MFEPKHVLTGDGHELTWQSNHLGHYLLVEKLLPLLESSDYPGRVVIVSSKLHLKSTAIDYSTVSSLTSLHHSLSG